MTGPATATRALERGHYLVLDGSIAPDRQVVPVPSVSDVRRELDAAKAFLGTTREAWRAPLKRYDGSWARWIAKRSHNHALFGVFVFTYGGICFGGLGSAALAEKLGVNYHTCWHIGAAVAGTVAAIGAIRFAVGLVARDLNDKREKRQIGKAQLEPIIDRFGKAEGVERALLAFEAADQRQELTPKNRMSSEAVNAVLEMERGLETIPTAAKRARVLHKAVRLAEGDSILVSGIRELRDAISQLPEAERQNMMTGVADFLRDSGKITAADLKMQLLGW